MGFFEDDLGTMCLREARAAKRARDFKRIERLIATLAGLAGQAIAMAGDGDRKVMGRISGRFLLDLQSAVDREGAMAAAEARILAAALSDMEGAA